MKPADGLSSSSVRPVTLGERRDLDFTMARCHNVVILIRLVVDGRFACDFARLENNEI